MTVLGGNQIKIWGNFLNINSGRVFSAAVSVKITKLFTDITFFLPKQHLLCTLDRCEYKVENFDRNKRHLCLWMVKVVASCVCKFVTKSKQKFFAILAGDNLHIFFEKSLKRIMHREYRWSMINNQRIPSKLLLINQLVGQTILISSKRKS